MILMFRYLKMSVQKPRRFTYYERMKASFSVVQEQNAKSLCNHLLSFIEHCIGETRPEILDFTDKKSEEKIAKFLLENRDFFIALFGNFRDFSSAQHTFITKDLSRSQILTRTIEKHCYQIVCLSALYSPSELQQDYLNLMANFLKKHEREASFGPVEITAWTALLLMINPVKLKQQCDGSVEIITGFIKIVSQQQVLPENPSKTWANPFIRATIQFAIGIGIKFARNSLGLRIPHEIDEIEFINDGTKNMAFEFMHAYIVQMPSFYEYSFSIDVIDTLVKNFISYFPDKLVELFNICEEEFYSFQDTQNNLTTIQFGQEEQKPTKSMNFCNLTFKALLELIGALYEVDNPQLRQLSKEFTDPKCEGLCNFICRGKAISAPPLKISYLSMLKSLCKSSQSAEMFFDIFK